MAQHRNVSVESTLDEDANYKPSWANAESEDRLSRRRSVECSATRISIPQTEHHQDHTVYVIRVATSMRSWTIKRRYRDFYYLDKELTKQYPNMQFPSLPPKRYLRSSSDPEIVDQRREQLEQYLNGLVGIPQVWARNDFVLFLNDESNIMTFIWNFERMRKLQDMLNALKMANTSETTKLTNDLNVATKQIKVLQTRLSQMEMIFLQQATGMASQQLPTEVLRSLSGVESSLSSLSSQLRSEVTAEHADLYQDKAVSPVKDREGASATDDANVFAAGEMTDEGAEHHAVPVEEVMRALNLAQDGSAAGSTKPRTAEDARAYAMSLQFQEAIHLSNQLLPQKVDIGLSPSPEKVRRPPSYDYHPSRKSPIISAKFVTTASENAFQQADLHRSTGGVGDVDSLSDVSNWTQLFRATADVLLAALLPTEQTTTHRHQVFKYIRDLVSTTLGCQLFPTGSLVSQCFLPDSGIDCTAFVPKMADDSWFVKINEALCLSAFGGNETASTPGGTGSALERVVVSNVSFVHDEIKMIRSMINSFSVTISTNQLASIYAEALIERIDHFVGRSHLFKRSVILLKAWFHYESARYTNGGGSLVGRKDSRLSSWAVVVLLIYIFNLKGAAITHPLQALGHFFAYYSSFDWSSLIMTVKGPAFRTEDNALAYITESRAAPAASTASATSGTTSSTGKFFPDEIFDFYRTANTDYLAWAVDAGDGAADTAATTGGAGIPPTPSVEDVQCASPVPPLASASATTTSPPASPCPTETSPTPASAPAPVAAGGATAATVLAHDLSAQMHNTDSLHFHPDYPLGPFNLINPVDRSQNLLAPLEEMGLAAFVSALHEGYKHFQSVCEELSKARDTAGTAAGTAEAHEKTNKLVRRFFANSCTKLGLDSFAKMAAYLDGRKGQAAADAFQVASADLQFSLSYGQLALGGKVDQRLLLHLIIIILDKKGAMPVGEIGKNLQALLSCDNLSKRLKEQFGGLKKAIERSNFTELRMGTEHPFNPIVTLLGESPLLSSDQQAASRPASLAHAAFLYTPYAVALQLQAQAVKEAQLAQAKTHTKAHKPKYSNYNAMNAAAAAAAVGYAPHGYLDGLAHSPYGSYPPPYLAVPLGYPPGAYLDTAASSASTSPKRGGGGGGAASGGQLSPPAGVYYAARGPAGPGHPSPPPPGRMAMGQAGLHSLPMPIPTAYAGMPMYPGPGGQPMYPGPPLAFSPTGPPPPYYMHCSLPGSLASSYGGPPAKMPGMGDAHADNA